MGYWPLQMAIVDRSQTSDNMDRWKAEMGRVRGEKRSKRKSQKKEDPGARKGRKVAKHCVFPMICGSGGSKSRLAKVAGAEPAGQMKDETLHAVVAWSVFPRSDHVWKFGCRKSARRCGAKHISRSKDKKHYMFGQLLEVEVMKKCTQLWRDTFGSWDDEKVHAVVARSTFRGQNVKSTTCSVWKLRCRFAWQAQGIVHLVKSEQTLGFCSISKKRWQAWDIWSGSGKMHFLWQAQYKRHVHQSRRSGRWFPERGCILEHQIFSFGKMILRDRCSTSYDLASLFRGRRSTLDRWSGKIGKLIGTSPSALHSTFHFWRKSRRTVSFLMLSTSKFEEVSQTCFVFDVVKFKIWGSLAELFRFWCCQA